MTNISEKKNPTSRAYTSGRIQYPNANKAQPLKQAEAKTAGIPAKISDTSIAGFEIVNRDSMVHESVSESSTQSSLLNLYMEKPSETSSKASSLLLKSPEENPESGGKNIKRKKSPPKRKPPPDLEVISYKEGPQRRLSKHTHHNSVTQQTPLSAEIFDLSEAADNQSISSKPEASADNVNLPQLPTTSATSKASDIDLTSDLSSIHTSASQKSSGLADIHADAQKFIADFKENVKQAQKQTRTARKTVPWMTRLGSIAAGLLLFTGHMPIAIAMAITFPVAGALFAKIQQRILLKKDNIQTFMTQMQGIEDSPHFELIKDTPEYKKAQEISSFLKSHYGLSILMTGLQRAYAPIFAGLASGFRSARDQNKVRKTLEEKINQLDNQKTEQANESSPSTVAQDNPLPALKTFIETKDKDGNIVRKPAFE